MHASGGRGSWWRFLSENVGILNEIKNKVINLKKDRGRGVEVSGGRGQH